MATLFLLPSLRYGGAAADARRMVLDRADSGKTHVAVLGETGPWEAELRQAGAPVHRLDWARAFDPGAVWALVRLLREVDATEVHCFERGPLRLLGLCGGNVLARTVAHRIRADEPLGRVDRWLLERVHRVVARTEWEASVLRKQGAPAARLSVVPFTPAAPMPRRAAAPFIVCVARLEHRHGPRDAVWAMDMLAYACADLELRLIGVGSLAPALERLQASVHFAGRTRFVPASADMRPVLQEAQACWITARPGHGLQVALEAQACDCPLVAYDQPALRELIAPGEKASFVPPGDMMALARTTFGLLRQDLARRAA
ncbi:MAG: glycosyltransferase [Gemmataceae bacterium]